MGIYRSCSVHWASGIMAGVRGRPVVLPVIAVCLVAAAAVFGSLPFLGLSFSVSPAATGQIVEHGRLHTSRRSAVVGTRRGAAGYAHHGSDSGLSLGALAACVVCLGAAGRVATSAWRESLRQSSRRGRSCVRAVNVTSPAAVREIGVVLLSAGSGKRMGANIPKQYLKLLDKEIALHSFEVFLECGVAEVVVVCAEEWRHVFQDYVAARAGTTTVIRYAVGGSERQDSVSNGLAKISTEFVAVHDAARPLVTRAEIEKVVADAHEYGAALLAVPTKATVKQATTPGDTALVGATPDRSTLWEAHTPQVVRVEALQRGFTHATRHSLEVTDDVSLIESLGEPVKLTEGEYTNIKVTTPEDMAVAETILRARAVADAGGGL